MKKAEILSLPTFTQHALLWAFRECLPFNGCECWPDEEANYSIGSGSLNLRFFDIRDGRPKPCHPTDWACAWDEEIEGRHRSKQIQVPTSALLLSADDIGDRILREHINALRGIV